MAPRWPAEHERAAVEFWGSSTSRGKYLESLPLKFLKRLDRYKRILSVWRPGTSATRSQGKPKIEGKNDICLSGCSSVTEAARIMGLRCMKELVSMSLAKTACGLGFGAMGL